MGKKYTIIVIPSDSSSSRRLTVTRRMMALLLLCVVPAVGASLYLARAKGLPTSRAAGLPPLENKNRTQKKILEKFSARLESLDDSLQQLHQLEDRLRVMASLKPGRRKDALGLGGVSGRDLPDDLERLAPSERRFARRLNRQFQDVERRAAEQESAFRDLLKAFRDRSVLLAHTPSISPVKGWLSSDFGYRRSPFTNKREFHAGIDIVARVGTPIFAPADGVVIRSSRDRGRYGRTLEIRHMQGIVTRYAHNSVNLAKVGQRVKRGQMIARVGSTGRSTGPHLHYEVRINGIAVNPELYIVTASR